MIIKVDGRETSLIGALSRTIEQADKCNVVLETMALPLGDCIITDDDGRERSIIERKTLKDLAASIRDGRYNEQSFRLNECSIHNHNVIYLIEGDMDNYIPERPKIHEEALVSSFITLTFYKGFSLYRAKTVDESARWLYQFATKLDKKGGNGYFEGESEGSQDAAPSYSEVIKRTKKQCVTPKNIGEIMLSQIPNVSMAVAVHLMAIFGNIAELVRTLEKNRCALDSITIESKNGKSRRLSKTSRENIHRYLVSEAQRPCDNE